MIDLCGYSSSSENVHVNLTSLYVRTSLNYFEYFFSLSFALFTDVNEVNSTNLQISRKENILFERFQEPAKTLKVGKIEVNEEFTSVDAFKKQDYD